MASIRKKGRSFKVGSKVGGSCLILPSSIVGADQINFLAIEFANPSRLKARSFCSEARPPRGKPLLPSSA